MTETQQRLKLIKDSIPDGVRLVAVSKFHPLEQIQQCYDMGQRIFGESHEQELRVKHPALPGDIEWHFIGHLQTNKVKYIAPYISLIHAVDSLKLLREINKQAQRCNRTIRCLLELHVADEATKYGFTPEACREMLEAGEWRELTHARIAGLMCMATNTDDTERIRQDFHTANAFFDEIKATYFPDDDTFCEKSWGMTHDYPIAVSEGATMVRVGTAIFGERQYV